jgi:hypothetical protein
MIIPFVRLSWLLSAVVVVRGDRSRVEKFGPTRSDERGITVSAHIFDGAGWTFADGAGWTFTDGAGWTFADGAGWTFADGAGWT